MVHLEEHIARLISLAPMPEPVHLYEQPHDAVITHRAAQGDSAIGFSVSYQGSESTGEGGCLSAQRMRTHLDVTLRIAAAPQGQNMAQRAGTLLRTVYYRLKGRLDSRPLDWDYGNTGIISVVCGDASLFMDNIPKSQGPTQYPTVHYILSFVVSMEVDTHGFI